MPTTAYHNVEIPLDNVVSADQKSVVPGAEPGQIIYSVALVLANFTDDAVPTGAQVRLFFGQNDEIILSNNNASFEFPCGHDDGVFFSNGVALAGKKVRLLVDNVGGGMAVRYAS